MVMQREADDFHLIDLASQAYAVQRHLRGRPASEKLAWLSERGEEYAYAFENAKVIRAAIDHTHVKPDAAIAGAREIAFFPPMTGG